MTQVNLRVNLKRVLVVTNKWWECDPALLAMVNANVKPPGFPWPVFLQTPRKRPDSNDLPPENKAPLPRATFDFANISVEVWCISDLLEHLKDDPSNQSSTERKASVLPMLFEGKPPTLVIAFGTAGYPSDVVSENGNVTIGTKVFIHDGHPNGSNPDSRWPKEAETWWKFDEIIDGNLTRQDFERLTDINWATASDGFLPVSANQASSNRVLSSFDNIALGKVNVTDNAEYDQIEQDTIRVFKGRYPEQLGASIETTHGLIRVQVKNTPFMFVSGIVSRLGHFNQEVIPRKHSQNTAASHNAGVTLAWLLPQIDRFL